jgi:hypothetical protein
MNLDSPPSDSPPSVLSSKRKRDPSPTSHKHSEQDMMVLTPKSEARHTSMVNSKERITHLKYSGITQKLLERLFKSTPASLGRTHPTIFRSKISKRFDPATGIVLTDVVMRYPILSGPDINPLFEINNCICFSLNGIIFCLRVNYNPIQGHMLMPVEAQGIIISDIRYGNICTLQNIIEYNIHNTKATRDTFKTSCRIAGDNSMIGEKYQTPGNDEKSLNEEAKKVRIAITKAVQNHSLEILITDIDIFFKFLAFYGFSHDYQSDVNRGANYLLKLKPEEALTYMPRDEKALKEAITEGYRICNLLYQRPNQNIRSIKRSMIGLGGSRRRSSKRRKSRTMKKRK